MPERRELGIGSILSERYAVQKLIHSGLMGNVYLAHDMQNRNVPQVIKEYSPQSDDKI